MRPHPRARRAVIGSIGVAGLAAAMLTAPGSGAQQAATVVVARPQPALPRTVELPGSFEPYEDALLHARVTGYVSKVDVDIGDRVRAGAPLVRLDLPEMEPALGRARADVLASQAALEAAEAQVTRDRITHKRLFELQAREPLAVMQQNVDMAAADLRVAEAAARSADAEISVDRARLEELQALMAYATIRAPFDAVIARRFVDPGALVVSGSDGGKPVLEVMREDRLRLVLAVPESLVPLTHAGMPTQITVDALPGRTFEATISRCAGPLSQDTRTMRAEIDMDHHDGLLRPGMYATVRLELGAGSDELSVPASLIRLDTHGHAFVWTVSDGKVAKTPVEVARDDGALAVIAGLVPESSVVVEGPVELYEGQPVHIASETETGR